mgnify:CR=1 FL=1
MKDETIELVKFRRLKRLLAMPDWQVVGILESLWLFARKNCRMGDVGRFSNEDIAAAIEYHGDAGDLVNALTDSKWLDEAPGETRLVCHDWPEHAPSFIVRGIAKFLQLADTRTATPILMAAWRVKMFGRSQPPEPDLSGASEPEMRPSGAPKTAKTAALAPARGPNQTQPNPTPPIAASKTRPTKALEPIDHETVTWEGVEGELKKCGVEYARAACESARANGTLPHEAMLTIRHFQAHPGAWQPALLKSKVANQREGARLVWPDPAPEYQQTAARAASNRSAEATRAKLDKEQREFEAATAAEATANAKLEREHGKRLDAMDRAKLKQFIATAWPESQSMYVCRLPESGPVQGVLRTQLLQAIDERSAEGSQL